MVVIDTELRNGGHRCASLSSLGLTQTNICGNADHYGLHKVRYAGYSTYPFFTVLIARILQKNYKGSLIEMETFEEQRLMDWKGVTEHSK